MRTKIGAFGLVVAGLVIGSLVASGIVRADDAPAKKHHNHHGVHGKITAVNGNTITVDVHQHHKKGEAKAAPESEDVHNQRQDENRDSRRRWRQDRRQRCRFDGGSPCFDS